MITLSRISRPEVLMYLLFLLIVVYSVLSLCQVIWELDSIFEKVFVEINRTRMRHLLLGRIPYYLRLGLLPNLLNSD